MLVLRVTGLMTSQHILQVMSPTSTSQLVVSDDLEMDSPVRRMASIGVELPSKADTDLSLLRPKSSGFNRSRSESRKNSTGVRFSPYDVGISSTDPPSKRSRGREEERTEGPPRSGSPTKEMMQGEISDLQDQLSKVEEHARAACHEVPRSQDLIL